MTQTNPDRKGVGMFYLNEPRVSPIHLTYHYGSHLPSLAPLVIPARTGIHLIYPVATPDTSLKTRTY